MIYDDRTGFSLISSVSQAADFLFANHKEYGSAAWLDAIDCCSRVKAGASTPEKVSTAFIAAMTGAGIRIDPTVRLY